MLIGLFKRSDVPYGGGRRSHSLLIVPCECGAKLRVDDAKIRDKSVKVRCPRCGNVLLVQKQPAERTDSLRARPAVPSRRRSAGACRT